ncbi:SAMP-activating enzyme E1 [Haloarchaeobius sp. TZWWS8]|uniref:SAMP-activating enzyme E1 n=1 Tax=Haloarchaeobius sp. TZWWS8 TaxID=3446121 RepID=UPI003EB71CAB
MADLSLDSTQLDRYSRHIIMEEVGPAGQQRLLDASVLCVGAGGLGSPAIEYLAAAGIGHLGIADDDVVERSNLQRQVIHRDADVGEPKAQSAARFVRDLNPDVMVDPIEERVSPENVEELVDEYDLVVDGSDNFATRYLVNDACVLSETPFVHGAIYKFEGQATTYEPGQPCYRCVFPEAPEPGTVADCATTGVLGVLPGTVGCIMATEAVKQVLNAGELLDDRLLLYDAMDMSFDEVPVRKNPDCAVCGDDPAIGSIHDVDYAETCAIE